MVTNKFYKRSKEEILNAARMFDIYHTTFREYVKKNPGIIKSSLDRGTISYPKEMHNDNALNLLGSRRTNKSFSYGPEEGDKELRQKIVEIENLRHKTSYSPDDVAIMPGAWAGLEFVIQEILNFRKGKAEGKVSVIGPTLYQMFYTPIEHFGIEMEAYDFVNSNFTHIPETIEDLDEIFQNESKIIVITNSNNPDGTYFKPKVLEEIIHKAEDESFFVVIDEIQNCFSLEGCGLNYGSWIQSPNVIRLDSPSKRYALSDCRVGWMIGNSKILYGEIDGKTITNRVEGAVGRMSGLMGNAPRIANDFLLSILDKEKEQLCTKIDPFKDYKKSLIKKRDYIIERLKDVPKVKKIYLPESCVNVIAEIDYPGTDLELSIELMKKGTLVMPTSGYGYNPKDSVLRFTFAERNEKLEHSMEIVKNYLSL